MKNLQKKQSNGDRLAQYFQKDYGEIVYSGALAIEAALFASGVKKGDYVILPDHVCYRILLSVVRLQAKPIIVTPGNGIILTIGDVKAVLKKHKVKAIILVHNMGIPVNVKSFKEFLPKNIVIIEDASQAWRLKYSGFSVGKHSDYVVTSFGKTKPLSLGIGGGLFSNDNSFKKYLDFNNKISRVSPDAILPYVLPETTDIDINKLIARGEFNFQISIRIANILMQGLNFPEIKIWDLAKGDVANWHRFPIFINSKEAYNKVLVLTIKYHIIYELPHQLRLSNIPLAIKHDSLVVNNSSKIRYQVNLFTNKNKVKDIKLWIKKLKKSLK